MNVLDRYPYAERAHCPEDDGVKYPMCGSASASHHDLDANPVVSTEADFRALPEDRTCWECRSIIA